MVQCRSRVMQGDGGRRKKTGERNEMMISSSFGRSFPGLPKNLSRSSVKRAPAGASPDMDALNAIRFSTVQTLFPDSSNASNAS